MRTLLGYLRDLFFGRPTVYPCVCGHSSYNHGDNGCRICVCGKYVANKKG